MFKKISCSLALVISVSLAANAQQTITFDSDNPGTSKKKKKKELKMNSATLGILSAFNGFVPVYYERKVADFLSLQAGVGLTFRSISNDIGQLLIEDGMNSEYADAYLPYGTTIQINDVADQYENYKYRNSRPGYCLSFSPRIYFNDNVMDGFFLAPEFSYKMYRYSAQLADETVGGAYGYTFSDDSGVPRSNKKMNEYMACTDYTLSIGGHYQKASGMAVMWGISAGLRRFQAERLDVYVKYDTADPDQVGGHYGNIGRHYTSLRPLMMFNLAIGGIF